MKTLTKFTRPEPTLFVGFEEHNINTNELTIKGYLQGQRVDKLKGLKTSFYDMIQYIGEAPNAKNNKGFIQALAWTKNKNIYQVLILKIN